MSQLFLNHQVGGVAAGMDVTREKMRKFYRFHVSRRQEQVQDYTMVSKDPVTLMIAPRSIGKRDLRTKFRLEQKSI